MSSTMTTSSKVKTFLVGAANLLATLAVLGILTHAYLGTETRPKAETVPTAVVAPSPDVVDNSDFFKSERFKRRQANKANKLLPSDMNTRRLPMGMMKKQFTLLAASSSSKGKGMMGKGKGKSSSSDEDCINLFPTPAPTKGKGKGMMGGKMMGSSRRLESASERQLMMGKSSSSSDFTKGYYYHSPAPSFFCPEPFLDIPLNWTVTAENLLNDGGWRITNNGSTIRFNIENSNDGFCAFENSLEQSGSATTTFTLDQAAELTATVSGLGEPFDAGNEVMNVFLDGNLIAQGQNSEIDVDPGCAINVTPECCASIPIEAVSTPTVLQPGTYTLAIDFTTTDGAYHVEAFFQTDLVFVPV